jgi:hypothetical protein
VLGWHFHALSGLPNGQSESAVQTTQGLPRGSPCDYSLTYRFLFWTRAYLAPFRVPLMLPLKLPFAAPLKWPFAALLKLPFAAPLK